MAHQGGEVGEKGSLDRFVNHEGHEEREDDVKGSRVVE